MTDFAEFLREAREAAALNQSELAERVGLTGSYISVLENRKKPPPSDKVLKRLAKALGVPERKMIEVAHLDRSPDDIREKIRALDRRLRIERKMSKNLLTTLLPSSLWHFGRVTGFHEATLEKLRLDGRKKRVLREILGRLRHLTSRSDFEAESRIVIEALPAEDRTLLAEVLPELVRDEPDAPRGAPSPDAFRVPIHASPPDPGAAKPPRALGHIPVAAADHRPGAWFFRAPDGAMMPRIEEGDLLLVDPKGKPASGEIAIVRIDGRPAVRSLVGSGRGLLFVASDSRVSPLPGRKADVAGIVTEIRRKIG